MDEPASKQQNDQIVAVDTQPAQLRRASSEWFPMAGGGETADGGAGDIGALLLSAVRRSKLWIACVFVLISAIAAPGVWLLNKPVFRATASVRVSPVVSRLVFKTEDNGIVPLYRSFRNTQVSIILGKAVLDRVLDREDVQHTLWFREPPRATLGFRPSRLYRLRDSLTVRAQRDSELIAVSLSAQRAADAKLLVDSVVEEYKKYSDETLKQRDVQRLDTLARERDRLQKEIDGLVATKFRVSSRLGTVDPEQLRSQLSIQLHVLESQFQSLSRDRSIAQWDLERATAGEQQAAAAGIGSEEKGEVEDSAEVNRSATYMMDSEWRKLNVAVETAGYQLEIARQRYGESHPRIAQLVAGLEHAEHLVKNRELQLDDPAFPVGPRIAAGAGNNTGVLTVDMLRKGLARLDQQLALLRGDADKQRAKVLDAGDIAKEIAHYGEEIRYKSDMYEAVRNRLNALKMEGKAPARIGIAAFAILPSMPYKDRRILLVVMALCGALAVGVGVACLRGMLDPRIREVVDVRASTQVPFLGQLPLFGPEEDLLSDDNVAVAESARMVRTALLQRLGVSNRRVVLITSSSSCAGKTSVAILLSKSLAQVGKRILLVEGDLRRPSLAERLNIQNNVGLAALLNGQATDSEAISPTRISGLDVLIAGDLPESFNSELLANGVFSACLKRWKQTYDFILLDSPPVLPVADARILSRHADGTIMVLRAAHCRRAEVAQTYADLSSAGGKLMGTVLVGVPAGAHYGYYGGYPTYASKPALKS